MLELGLHVLWFLVTYEIYAYYSLLAACLFILMYFAVTNYGPLLFGYESAKYSDAIWMMDSPNNRMIIASTAIYEKTTAEQLRSALEKYPIYGGKRARQYFTFVYARPYWVEDKHFTFDAHFHVVKDHIRSKKDLCEFASKLPSVPFPEKYPPWCFFVIENYLDNCSAVVTKFHHAMMDGISLVNATVHCSDPECPREFFKTPKKSRFQRALNFLHAAAVMPYYEIARGLYKADSNPLLGKPLSGVKSIYWTQHYSLSSFKQHCRGKGITLNDFLAAPCLRAVKRYIQREYAQDCDNFTMYMPFSIRGQPQDGSKLPLSNYFIPLMIPMPSAASPMLESECSRVFQRLKNSIIPLESDFAFFMAWVGFPASMVRKIIISNSSKGTFVYSNTAGPISHLKCNGVKLLHMMPISSINAKTGLAITLFSYADEFSIICYADRAIVSDCETLASIIEEEIEAARLSN